MGFYGVFEQISILFIILIVGFVTRKLQVISDNFIAGLSGFLLKVALPALIINSLLQSYDAELLKAGGQMLGIAVLTYAFSALMAWLLPALLKTPPAELGVFRFVTMFPNVGFMGFPVIQTIFGEKALFYAAIYNLPFNLLVFTLGVTMLSLGREEGARFNWRSLISPASAACAIGLVLFVFSVQLPGAISSALATLGSLTTPLSMILVGGILANMEARTVFGNWRVYAVSLMRLLAIPYVIWAILRLFIADPLLVGVPTILSGMPAAVNSVILAQEYGANPSLASQAVFISTLLSALSIPLLAAVLF